MGETEVVVLVAVMGVEVGMDAIVVVAAAAAAVVVVVALMMVLLLFTLSALVGCDGCLALVLVMLGLFR